ncbi:hypothetical protein EXIGLDRAFT_182523 [Exidia glandulosa HHB12029]|uniref:F-box domain-containing protein n=1 Tax=Exidia glandulosa HHB12029 TaxID=1314781 RepID=A0A165F1S4_EXIGL|nr:hypothetical protein EXIGLDRAFT_182523 [Exidia glandulosa HHB12029]
MYCSRSHAGFPSLRSLALSFDYSFPQLIRLLELVKDTMHDLFLEVGVSETLSSPMTLPLLETLTIIEEPVFVAPSGNVMLIAPTLHYLGVDAQKMAGLQPLLRQFSSTLVNIDFFGAPLDTTVSVTCEFLQNVACITFPPDAEPKGSFFSHLATSIPCSWLRLQRISFADETICDKECYDGLPLLLASVMLRRSVLTRNRIYHVESTRSALAKMHLLALLQKYSGYLRRKEHVANRARTRDAAARVSQTGGGSTTKKDGSCAPDAREREDEVFYADTMSMPDSTTCSFSGVST